MFKYSILILISAISLAAFNINSVFAEMEMEHDKDDASILELAPLAVGCTVETAVLTNVVDLDRNKFIPNCIKISLSDNPTVKCTSFDFVRHDVVILKDGVSFGDRVVSHDLSSEERKNLPSEWTYNFETGEFLRRRNDVNPSLSTENIGEGPYNIWCRYHFLSGMTMRLWVVQ